MSTISDLTERVLSLAKAQFDQADCQRLAAAIELAGTAHAGQKRGTGEPYVTHPLVVTGFLLEWKLDAPTVIAGVLHDVPEDTPIALDQIKQQFGPEVAQLVEGVTKLAGIRMPKDEGDQYDVEDLRRLFLAMAADIRVVLLKLADRLHNMRTLKGVPPEKRVRIARETLDLFAPLADRLGMGEVRSELEDLGFRYAEPEEYAWTAKQVQQSARKRAQYLLRVEREFSELLAEHSITAKINSRTKNLHSLYRKLLQKERDIDKVYDLFAIRVIVDDVAHCYQSMGIIHQRWQPLPHRMKDYIAMPKLNGYRSLHTTVFGPGQRLLEVQFRTTQMHQEAELGVAAHAVYAERKQAAVASREELAIVRQLTAWQEEIADSPDFVDRFKLDLFANRIYVFTPKGAPRSLPAASTPIDFAYAVHTEIGHRCRGAKVNGVMVPLSTQLENGDVVEILTNPTNAPKRDWLGVVKTGHARNQIRAWFRRNDRAQNQAAGRELLDATLAKAHLPKSGALSKEQLTTLRTRLNFDDVEALWLMVGEGRVALDHVQRLLQPSEPKKNKTAQPQLASKVKMAGLKGLSSRRAKCCEPQPNDTVVGYITVGNGITIHRVSCAQVKRVHDKARLLPVSWETT